MTDPGRAFGVARARADVARAVATLRRRPPLVHCITAAVSMQLVADGLLATGARPMMTETAAEAPTLVTAADALLVGLGTLSVDGAEGIPPTVGAAVARGVPWVLDPTAIGLAPVRTPLARELVTRGPAVVRGNASEVLALAGSGHGGRGADATDASAAAVGTARQLAREHGVVVAVSGEVDVVTDGAVEHRLSSGTSMLTQVTGTGCLLGGLVAAYCAVATPLTAALTATAHLTVAAELAAEEADGPGSFRVELLDALHLLGPDAVAQHVVLS